MSLQNRKTLPETERLKSRKDIEELFQKGSSFYLFPFVVKYTFSSERKPAAFPRVLISVPRKKFKKAIHRNTLRRRIREAYRQNKELLLNTEENQSLDKLGLIYVAKEEKDFNFICYKLTQVLDRLRKT